MAEQRSDKTHSRILNSAAIAFAEHGYDGASVAEICRRAEVSKGAFYHHFPSKQDVFLELLQGWLSELDTELMKLQRGHSSVPEKLLHMTELIRRVFQAAEDQLSIFLEFWSQATHDPVVWEATIAPYERYRAFFARMVRSGIDEGTLQPVDPDTTARVIVSLALGLVLQGLMDAEGTDWGEVGQRGIRMLLEGIQTWE
ncbi:MAG: TetR/AcrR family transcriptional regulator [Anaerolineae bacterium]|jgi:AcrR family transcriptional regulator